MYIFRLVFINALIFLVLLFVINWTCGIFLKKADKNTRDELPNYATDREHAREIFKDYRRVQHRYEPFVGWKALPYSGKTISINKTGNRIHNAPETDNRDKTVHFIGGSTMWGEGSDDQHTIPALFNKKLPQYEVFNHGQLAYNTRQELDALISLYSKNAKIDVVIFYDGVNDAAFLCPKEINDLPAHRLVPMYREKLYVPQSKVIKEVIYKTFIGNIIELTQRFANKEKKASAYDCSTDPNKAEEIAEIMMKNWEMANEIVTNRGGKFIAILQPAAFIGNPKTDHLELDEELGKNFTEVYTRIKQKIKERNHPWIFDLSNVFDRDEYIYIDFCHVSPNGNQIIAEKIAEILAGQMSLADAPHRFYSAGGE